jgi:glycogen operon protein
MAGVGNGEEDLQVLVNMSGEPLSFILAESPGRTWHLALDTAAEAPRDIAVPNEQSRWTQDEYMVSAHSLVVLEGR